MFENNELRIGFYPWNEHDSCKFFLIIDKITGKFGLTTPNPYQLPKLKGGKVAIIDVKATDQLGRTYIIELH